MNEPDVSAKATDGAPARLAEPESTGSPRSGAAAGHRLTRALIQWARRWVSTFWLTEEAERRKQVPEPTAARLAVALEDTRQDTWAAGYLSGLGLRRSAHRLQQLSLERLDAGLKELASLNLEKPGGAAGELSAADERPVLGARADLIRARVRRLEPWAESPTGLRLRRLRRSLVLSLVVVGGPLLLWKLFCAPSAEASSYFGRYPFLAADQAIDGDLSTEWLLENGQTGWLDVHVPSRRIKHVRWVNAKNIAADPRATKDFRIELWHKDRLVNAAEGTATLSPNPGWNVVDVDGRGVDRIRFVVKSFHNSGGGIAELAWD